MTQRHPVVLRVASRARQLASSDPRLRRRAQWLLATLPVSRRQLAELQAEIQETRRLQQRLAELTDLAAEVLISAADRNDPRVRRALEEYAKASF